MATPALHVVSRLAPSTSVDLKAIDTHIRVAISRQHAAFAQLAYWGWKLKLENGYGALGFVNEFAYMASLGIGKTQYYEAVAVGQALQGLTLEQLEQIPRDHALLLMSVKPELRTAYPWSEEAKTDSFRQLAQKIETRNAEVPGPVKVPMSGVGFRVPATAREAIYKNLAEFQEKHDLRSIGQALEFAVAEKVQDASVLGDLHAGLKLLTGVQKVLSGHSDLERECQWLGLAKDRFMAVYKKLLAGSREDKDEVHAEKVHASEVSGGDQDDEGWQGSSFEQHGGAGGEVKA
jgi:hypothetical protein